MFVLGITHWPRAACGLALRAVLLVAAWRRSLVLNITHWPRAACGLAWFAAVVAAAWRSFVLGIAHWPRAACGLAWRAAWGGLAVFIRAGHRSLAACSLRAGVACSCVGDEGGS